MDWCENVEKAFPAGRCCQVNAVQELDIRVRITILLLVTVIAFSVRSEIALLLCFLSMFAWISLFGFMRQAVKYAAVYVLLWGLLLLTGKIQVIGDIPLLTVYIRRVLLPVLAAVPVSNAPTGRFIASLSRMRMPKPVILSTTIIFRFLPTIGQEYKAIRDAQKFRGIGTSVFQTLLHPLKNVEYILIPLLIRISRIADELSASAMVRGIRLSGKVTSFYGIHFCRLDFCALFFGTLWLSGLYIMDIWLRGVSF
ncbi:MAG: energy-coupling factor transporter transmembrane component T family protein [Lachnospiraceae bacterium]